jgi:hypothetical protein
VKESGNRRFSKCLRRVAAAIVASGAAATSLTYAWPSDKPIVVQPAALPESAGAVQLDAPGRFDFVSKVGSQAEIVRFLDGKRDAVFDLNEANAPALETAQRLTLQGTTPPLIEDGVTATSQIDPNTQPSQDYQLVEIESLEEFNGVLKCEADSSASDESRHRDHLLAHGKRLISDQTPDRRAGEGAS